MSIFENFNLMYNLDLLFQILVGVLVLLFILVSITVFAGFGDLLKAYAQKLLRGIDNSAAALAFGQTPAGHYVNQKLSGLNISADPYLKAVESLPYLKWLQQMGVISPEQFSEFSANILAAGIKLTNGVPDVEFSVLPTDGGQPIKRE